MTEAIITQLSSALAAVYRRFEVPVPSAIEGCPCCIETRGTDVLLSRPLRALTGQELWRYVTGAFYTVGGLLDFRYLLPRILELSIIDPDDLPDVQIVLHKLHLAKWQTWPDGERQVLIDLLDVWYEAVLLADLADLAEVCCGAVVHRTDGLLCGRARAGLPLAPWLARLCEPDVAPVLAVLRETFPKTPFAFWDDERDAHGQVALFLGL